MDKFEIKMRIEKLKQLVEDKDYVTAQKVVDSINWKQVRSAGLLTLAASVDEENGKLDAAKEKLVAALELVPVGKNILYKLTELAVRTGDVDEAETYYQEFHDVAPDDPACLLLQYMIMKVKHTPYPQLIECLEYYNQYDSDERWMYELATTYESAGRIPDMVALCDRIALMFGDSPYALKALKLKSKYERLTDDQRALLYPNSIAGQGVHYVKDDPGYQIRQQNEYLEKQESEGDILARNRIENEDDLFRVYAMTHDPSGREPVPAFEEPGPREKMPKRTVSAPQAAPTVPEALAAAPAPHAAEVSAIAAQAARAAAHAAEKAAEAAIRAAGDGQTEGQEDEQEKSPVEAVEETVFERALKAEKRKDEAQVTEETPFVKVAETAEEPAVPEAVPAVSAQEEAEIIKTDAVIMTAELEKKAARAEKPAPAPAPKFPEYKPVAPIVREPKKLTPADAPIERRNMIVEANDDQVGLNIAIAELKRFHAEYGSSQGAIKITAEKLNETGITDVVFNKIRGKDFIIEHAGELDPELTDDLYDLMLDDTDGTTVVLIDNPDGIDKLEDAKAELLDTCDYISDQDFRAEEFDEAAPKKQPVPEEEDDEAEYEENRAPEEEDDEDDGYDDEEEDEDETKVIVSPAKKTEKEAVYKDEDQMSVDDFVEYCEQYATDIDCVMDTDAHLALYQRVELMEEDGIPLTKKAAVDLMENTADIAEHPKSLARKLKSKYDKNNNLIIKEEDFLVGR